MRIEFRSLDGMFRHVSVEMPCGTVTRRSKHGLRREQRDGSADVLLTSAAVSITAAQVVRHSKM